MVQVEPGDEEAQVVVAVSSEVVVADSQEVDSVAVIGAGEAGVGSQAEVEVGSLVEVDFLVGVDSLAEAEAEAGEVDADAEDIDLHQLRLKKRDIGSLCVERQVLYDCMCPMRTLCFRLEVLRSVII